MSNWIEWSGGECPVPPNTMIETQLRNGSKIFGFPADSYAWCWYPNGSLSSDCDIVSYRVVSDENEPDSKPEKRRLSAQPDADGWIEWRGGECPVPPDTMVEVRLRNGSEDYVAHGQNLHWLWFEKPEFKHADIVAYRVVNYENESDSKPDLVNSPSHYTDGGIETIDFIEAKLGPEGFLGFCLGNALKYISRAGKKDNLEQDLSKAIWYLKKAGGK